MELRSYKGLAMFSADDYIKSFKDQFHQIGTMDKLFEEIAQVMITKDMAIRNLEQQIILEKATHALENTCIQQKN